MVDSLGEGGFHFPADFLIVLHNVSRKERHGQAERSYSASTRSQLRRRNAVRLRTGRRHCRSASTSIACAKTPGSLHDFQILVIPGGFTYGDDVAAGKILACQLTPFPGRRAACLPGQGEADPRRLQRLSGAAQGGPDPAARRGRPARHPDRQRAPANSRIAGSRSRPGPANVRS